MRVLVVEDNSDLGHRLAQGLREHGYEVDLATNVGQACHELMPEAYELVVLDRTVHGRDGNDVLRELRNAGVTAPAIFLTARASTDDHRGTPDPGSDDYLVKSFSFAELLDRIRQMLRPGGESSRSVLRVADLSLDPTTHLVERAGRSIDLTAKQFDLLRYLMQHPGQVVSRAMIQEHVWKLDFDTLINAIDVHIKQLKDKVDRDSDRPLIHTLRGIGYILREE